MPALNVCPYCFSSAVVVSKDDSPKNRKTHGEYYNPECTNKNCVGGKIKCFFETEYDAVLAWNTRY